MSIIVMTMVAAFVNGRSVFRKTSCFGASCYIWPYKHIWFFTKPEDKIMIPYFNSDNSRIRLVSFLNGVSKIESAAGPRIAKACEIANLG